MEINIIQNLTPDHYKLLLEADPSKKLVDDYVQRGQVFTISNPELIGIMVLVPTRPDTVELVNLSVDEHFQNQGFAQKLIAFAIDYTRKQGFKTLDVGTGSIGFAQLYLYQKCGFRMVSIDRDFFLRHYDEEIIENGMILKDMVRLSQDL